MTKTQARVLEFVRQFIGTHGYSPSLDEIADGVGSYSGNVHSMLVKLAERGYLHKGRGWRNIRLIERAGDVARAA
jgi:SOS-response transcriptional repressor LexA